ncbi:tRNA (5-methylaminomethyl-2-thiouridine)(34)-methyltransferase MnmD [Xinfangfangia sp. CPCC 101601]|uniref:tRNA (5-methylaminomethyl-2-thiouridine)(34)-methyltransferase MnmD n=1 Tax=Pseudogemmobacter lacusdianii TaxID=3069608 RepID=A0ABU0VZZ8_9RHOB|nr:tRNA (5-methylaminomethyl-2-thiouridine)(34)-methyltransferase MnmD [Xinfangfangia sp. CPCC 101601]MDQ2066465.1 tRNA (5-methylaminomethyl-2-thiouridine)(34)-methyltransferase MnmD [Xinfangfangia sp. CPCC 101601]
MPHDPQSPDLDWREGAIPVSRRFDDPYFSLAGGLEETRHVFLTGNNLPERLTDGFHIAELGFGTGLNLLALALMWQKTNRPGRLRFTTFEAYPMPVSDMARAHEAFPEIASLAADLRAAYRPGPCQFTLADIEVTLIAGDAREALPNWSEKADAWFLDGFSPAKNPELWSAELMQQVGLHTAPAGSFATYTAAGHVRRSLQEAGFTVTRIPGYAHKRHMSIGQRTA